MSMLFTNRKLIGALWPGVLLGLFVLAGPPLTLASGSLLLLAAVAPPTIMLILSSEPALTMSEAIGQELRPADKSREPVKGLSDGSPPHRG